MAEFQGAFHERFTIPAPPDRARDHFADRDAIAANYGDLQSADRVGDAGLAFVLNEKNHGFTTFQGRYTCFYEKVGDDRVAWRSEGGNIDSRGTARFEANPDGTTTMDYEAQLTIDMDVNPVMAAMLRPVVAQFIAVEMKQYVQRMIRSL